MIDVQVADTGLNINVTIEGSGPPGKPGDDGISPTVNVAEIENGHKVTITDKDGAKSFEVTNGRDGTDGTDGKSPYVGENGHWFEWQDGEYVDTGKVAEGRNGDDGVSPTVEVTQTGTGHKVVITDKDGEKSFDVSNGQNGEDGEDGVSPTIAVEDVDGGHKVTITTATGSQSFTILNGKDGDPGRPGNDGDPGEDGLTPNISIGTVETLPSGSKATAEITGQTPNLVLNMGIPEGKQGDPGSGGSTTVESYEWRLIRTVIAPEDPTTDQSGVTWKVNDDGNIFGFEFDTDENGLPFEAEEINFTFDSSFNSDAGVASLNVGYESSKVIAFYRSWPKAGRRGVFYQNKLTEDKSTPLLVLQTRYTSGATVDAPWSNPTPPITSPNAWRYFGFSSGVSTCYMANFTFKIYGRFKR